MFVNEEYSIKNYVWMFWNIMLKYNYFIKSEILSNYLLQITFESYIFDIHWLVLFNFCLNLPCFYYVVMIKINHKIHIQYIKHNDVCVIMLNILYVTEEEIRI